MTSIQERRWLRRSLPPSYGWVRGIAYFWLVLGAVLLFFIASDFLGIRQVEGSQREYLPLAMLLASLHVLIPIAMIFRWKLGFYGGLLLSGLLLLAIPIGTLFGIITIKALMSCKSAFGIS